MGHHLISIIYGKEEEMLHFEYLTKIFAAYVRETIYSSLSSLIHSVVWFCVHLHLDLSGFSVGPTFPRH